ncbi:MAG: M48 family metalloprotease [Gammaproteobacteria bacterium]|nr:M48 family metalloprotease [Gammaproteobacteria bacterium]
MKKRFAIILSLLAWLAGCAVNPVTGEREFILVSGDQEVAMGTQNYAPMLQSQGGAYDVDPALTRYVQTVGNKLAVVSDAPLPYEFTVLNNSVPNAWALPGGKIAINRGLLTEINSEAELAAVLGHEIVHAAARHTAKQMSRGMLMQGLVVGTAIAASDSDYGNLAVGGASIGAQLIMQTYGRSAELESDRYGMRYMSKAGYDPQGAVQLQKTFVRLSEGRNQDWLSGLFASHPPSQDRVNANIQTAAELPPGGILGEDSFRVAMQQTRDVKPAYDAYDEGRKALSQKKIDEALTLVDKALDLYPAEAHFHALRGDVRLVNDQYDMAVTNYNRAISRRGNFFYYHLQRGIANKQLGQTDLAITDLERSVELLPTAPAHYTLGTIKAERGDVNGAIEHYRVVAKSGGEYGKAATDKLVVLELPSQPGNYVQHRCDAGANGRLVVSVKNNSSVAVRDVQVVVDYRDNLGQLQQLRRNVGGRLEPGEVASADTGLGPYTGPDCPVRVIAARVAD